MKPGDIVHFDSASAFREWLEGHHSDRDELWVGFWKKGTGRPSLTWEESVDEALCFGWIDGIQRSVDDEAYTIRFTPRRERSKWSPRNLDRYAVPQVGSTRRVPRRTGVGRNTCPRQRDRSRCRPKRSRMSILLVCGRTRPRGWIGRAARRGTGRPWRAG